MIQSTQKQKRQENAISFNGWPLGENTSVPAFQLKPQELSACIDLKYNHGGQLETREAITKYTNTQIGAIKDIKSVTLSGTQYVLCTDVANKKVYYISTLTPTLIGTVSAAATIVPYNDVALICDGSYLKYCDSVTAIKIAYDAGSAQYDNYSGDDDIGLKVGDGTNTRVAAKFTSQAWDAGYTIPITKVEVMLKKTGAPTGAITCKLRLVSDDSILATKDFSESAAEISTTSAYYSVTFATVTTEMSTGIAYYASIEHTGDASNYIEVRCTTVASGGVAYEYHTAAWNADATKNPIIKVYPSRPPKASFGVVAGNRPWIKNPDAPGRAYFGNVTHLDWSTPNGGGWVGVVDDNANSFEIGAFEDLFGTIYIFGTENHPFVCKLEGAEPIFYSLPLLFQQSWTTPNTLVNTNNDLWFSSDTGTDNLSGVQEFGDLRTFSVSEPVKDAFNNWSSSTAIAGYYPADGQYWLYLGQTYVHVCHTKQPIRLESGELRYPWSRYSLPAVPTCFQQAGNNFLIGSSDGFIYTFDSGAYKDLDTTQIEPEFKTAYQEMPGMTVDLSQCQVLASSRTGSTFTINFLKNGVREEGSSSLTKTFSIPMSDAVTIAELSAIPISDLLNVAITPSGNPMYFDLNMNCYSIQIKVSEIQMLEYPVFINGLILKFKEVEQR